MPVYPLVPLPKANKDPVLSLTKLWLRPQAISSTFLPYKFYTNQG